MPFVPIRTVVGTDDEEKSGFKPLQEVFLEPREQRGAITAGLSSGVDQLQGLGYSVLGGTADILGANKARDWANEQARRNQIDASLNGRPDLERIEDQSLSSAVPYAAYQLAKQVPLIAGITAAQYIPGVGQAASALGLARLGAVAPRVVGGGGLEAGANFAARRAALAQGETLGANTLTGSTLGFGSLYGESVEGGDPSALKALALAPAYGLAEAVLPAALQGGLRLPTQYSGGMAKRMLKSGAVQGVGEAGTESFQNELEMGMRSDLTDEEKFSRRINAAAAGLLVGGGLGTTGGIRGPKTEAEPIDLTDTGKTDTTEQRPVLGLQYSPLAGTPIIFPDGSVALNGEQEMLARTGIKLPAATGETDLTAPAATTPAATETQTTPKASKVFDETDRALLDRGVVPNGNRRAIYDQVLAEGFDPDDEALTGFWTAMAEGKTGTAKKQLAQAIAARNKPGASNGTGVSAVQQPAGSVGVGGAVVPGSVGDAGSAAPVTGTVVGSPAATGGALQQTGLLPVAPSQPSTPVTQTGVPNQLTTPAITGAQSGTQASQTIQTTPQRQEPTTRGAAGTTALVDTSDDALEIARATGNAAEIEAMREDEAGLRGEPQDFTDDDLNSVIDQHLSKSKDKERDRKILRAYITARRAVPAGYKGNIAKEIAAAFGVVESRVRQIGNPESLAKIAESMGFSRDQLFDALGIQSAKKAAATELGKLEGELTRLESKAKPSQADIDRMAELSEQIERVKGNIESGDMAAALKNMGFEGEAGDTFSGMDDSREWQKASTAGSQVAVDLVAIADAIDALKAAAAELQQLNLPQAAAGAAESIDALTAKYEALIAAATAPKPERKKSTKKTKSEAEQAADEEKRAAQEAAAEKARAERAAKLQADRNGLAVGDTVMNPKLGTGVVKSFAGDGDATTVTVEFKSGQTKELSVKLAKLEKVNAIQVESPASVPVQPKAETGKGVGGQVRRAKKPAPEGKAPAPTKILTQAEQAAEAWDKVAADYPTAPKFADLTPEQQKTFIGFGEGNWERSDVELELTKLARVAAAKSVSSERPTGNESVLINSREIKEDDDIALGDESRVGAIMISTVDKVRDGKPGRASAALKEMTDWADANNKRLVLMPSGSIAGSKGNLVAWYERNGFVQAPDGAMVREPAPKQLTNEPFTIDVEARVVDETVGPQVAALPAPQVTRLENHYGVKQGTPEFLAKVKADVVLYATKGAEAVAGAIRDIIKTIHAGVLSVAMIFNPTAVSQIESFVVIPQETQTTTQQVLAEVPAEVQGMSDAGKQAYATLIPALKGKIGDKFITIADKPSGRIFVFKANGDLVLQKKALFGLAKGDLYKGNNDLPSNRVTPAGLFGIKVIDAAKGGSAAKTAGEYDFGKVFALEDPDAVVTFMHSVWLKESDAAKRAAALKNDSAADSRYSFGCINVDKDTFKDMVGQYGAQMDGSKLFVVPDVQSTVNDFITGNVANDKLVREGVQPVTKTTTTPVKSATKTAGVDRTVTAKEEELFLRKSRQSTRLFSTDLYLGKENVSGQPQYGRELRNPVTLNDGTRLDGFTSQDQSVFSGYDRNGQRVSVPQESVNPSDIKSSRDSNRTANALKAALGTTRKSRRSVRTADQSGTEFESVEASLEDLSNYSEGIAAGIRRLQNSGMGNAVDAIDSWMVTFSPVSWDAIYTVIDGKRTIIYNGVILKDKALSIVATLHEVGHGIDEVQGGAGKFSGDKEFKLSRVNGELMAMRPGTAMDELLTHWEDNSETSALGGMLNYPFDMTDPENRSLTMQELREEVFAQVWAFSNMNGGMDYLRDNLPATHAFMEKAHEQVKATTYTTAQGAKQGAQSGQVQAGQQNAQPTGAISRASRQAKINSAVGKLPKQAQKPVGNSINTINDWIRQGLDRAVFTSDLIKRAVDVGIKSAAAFEGLLARRATKVRSLEREVERIADMYVGIEEENKGTGPNSVNQFIFESTRTGKWGYDNGNLKADPAMAAQFKALQPKAQAFVKAIFAHGDKMLSAKKKAVVDYATSEYDARIAAATDPLEKAQLLKDKANDLKKFASLFKIREGIPYAPIKRFGDHVVIAKSQAYINAVAAKDTKLISQLEKDPDHYHVSFTETKNEARNLAAQLEDQGFFKGGTVAFKERLVADKELFGNSDSLGAITRLRAMADAKANAGDKGAAQMQRMVSDLYLQALAEGSARKSEMRRRGVAGEVDMLRSFAAQGRADANFVASVEYNPQVQDAIQAMREESNKGSGDLNRKSEILNEITRRYESSLDAVPAPNIAKLTRLSSIYYLATSPAYYLQNLTQPWMMSVPAMAGRHDYTKASTALFTAYGQLGGVMKSARLFDQQFDFSKVPADVRDAIQELANRGKIDIGLETELGEFKIDGDSKFSKGWNKVDKGMRIAVQKVEALNRLSTAMAAYRLELAKTGNKEAAINYADRILTETHGDYSAFNAPRFFNNPVGKVALQFRKFQLIQLSYYAKLLKDAGFSTEEKRAATKALVYSLGHTALLAGAMGLPGYSAIAWALGALFGDDDDPLDVTAELRKFIGDETMANLIMRGAPTLAGVDISGKVGAGNMLSIMPFSQADLTTKAGVIEAAGTLLGGAPVGMIARVADGIGQMLSGEWYKGMEQILPKGLGDAAKAYRISNEGMTRRNGDVVLPPSEISAWETAVQALGIQPVQQSVAMERQQNTLEMNQFYQDRSTKVKADYIKALRAGKSTAEARAAWEKLQKARVENGYTRQPLSELLKAPQAQAKRERQVINGVQFNKANKRFVEEQI